LGICDDQFAAKQCGCFFHLSDVQELAG